MVFSLGVRPKFLIQQGVQPDGVSVALALCAGHVGPPSRVTLADVPRRDAHADADLLQREPDTLKLCKNGLIGLMPRFASS